MADETKNLRTTNEAEQYFRRRRRWRRFSRQLRAPKFAEIQEKNAMKNAAVAAKGVGAASAADGRRTRRERWTMPRTSASAFRCLVSVV